MMTQPDGTAVGVTINIREPHAVQSDYDPEWSCDYEFLVGYEPPHLRTGGGMDSLSALHMSLFIAAVTLDDLRAEGALSWPNGTDDVGLPGIVVNRGLGPLGARAFEPKLDLYAGDRPVVGSYEAEFTPPGGTTVPAIIGVREPRYDEARGWLADWELVVGSEAKVRACAWGVDSFAALHAAMVGASISLEDLKAEGEVLWLGMMEVGMYQTLSCDLKRRHGPASTDVGIVILERVLELYPGR